MKQAIDQMPVTVEKKKKKAFPEFESLKNLSGQHKIIFEGGMAAAKKNNEEFLKSVAGKKAAKQVSGILMNFGIMTEQVSEWNDKFSKSEESPRELTPEISEKFGKKVESWLKNPQDRRVAMVKARIYDKFDLRGVDGKRKSEVIKLVGKDNFESLIRAQLMGEMTPGREINEVDVVNSISNRMYETLEETLAKKKISESVESSDEVEKPKKHSGLEKVKTVSSNEGKIEIPRGATEEEIVSIQEEAEREKELRQEIINTPEQMKSFFQKTRSELARLVHLSIINVCQENLEYDNDEEFNRKWRETTKTYVNRNWGKGFTTKKAEALVSRLKSQEEEKTGKQTGQLSMYDTERIASLIYDDQVNQMESEITEIIEEINSREKDE